MQQQFIRKVAILGAGVMGAQIAALFASADIEVILFDLPCDGANKNQIAQQALQRLNKLKPAPLATAFTTQAITPANYDDDLALLSECDLVLEAVAESLEIKKSLFGKITPHLHEQTILASNTSGISINELAEHMAPKLHSRFCGIHFFNPPRYMQLVEIIACEHTSADVLAFLETFLTSTLGKGVLYAKDTPNFIANRVGIFSMLSVLHHAQAYDIPLEVVDALTGPLLGRPKSATLRTADVVGLDTMGYVVNTMAEHLNIDPWSKYYALPQWIHDLIGQGALGQKSGAGIYQKVDGVINVFDLHSKTYRPAELKANEEVVSILKMRDPAQRLAALHANQDPQAQFLWSHMRDVFHYCAVHGQAIAYNLRDIDLALQLGFGWKEGPFTTWQRAGWHAIAKLIESDIQAGKSMAETHLPAWATAEDFAGVYNAQGAYAITTQKYQPRSQLPVYQRQLYPIPVLAESYASGDTLFENDSLRIWQLGDDNIAIASFKTKMNTINEAVLDGIMQAIDSAERNHQGLILWQNQGDHFSVGADLKGFAADVESGNLASLDRVIDKFQQTSLRLRYSSIPTVAAIKGMVFGGGCELMLHCDQIVAANETYIGLVEAGVGLLPAGGGTKEFALRAAQSAINNDVLSAIQPYYMQIAKAEVSASAQDARLRNFLRATDTIIFNPYELLYVAKQCIAYQQATGYRPQLPQTIRVAGKPGVATLRTALVNMREGGFISEYDYHLAGQIAEVICGGDVEANSEVDEQWLLDLERSRFIELAQQEKTQARIIHTLKTGKPLRN